MCDRLDASKHYCAVTVRFNVCWNDIGAPLVYFNNGTWQVYGIASRFSIDRKNHLCDWSAPSLYTSVPNFIKWIRINTEK